mmetsp:Transcript_46152/g.100736  ORF Transcript_46152/g.100736 Transcript_46152/m.100736 type:complete len:225 (-) Transcript_46152:488-1162(-)
MQVQHRGGLLSAEPLHGALGEPAVARALQRLLRPLVQVQRAGVVHDGVVVSRSAHHGENLDHIRVCLYVAHDTQLVVQRHHHVHGGQRRLIDCLHRHRPVLRMRGLVDLTERAHAELVLEVVLADAREAAVLRVPLVQQPVLGGDALQDVARQAPEVLAVRRDRLCSPLLGEELRPLDGLHETVGHEDLALEQADHIVRAGVQKKSACLEEVLAQLDAGLHAQG